MELMDGSPHMFCLKAGPGELNKLLEFRHRTFNPTDLLYTVDFLRHHFRKYETLEKAFSQWMEPGDHHIEKALNGFHHYFLSLPDAPARTRKHIAAPFKRSTCKRLNMFLRWMVRSDENGVDFGIWRAIAPSQLVCPVDLHVARVARRLGLIKRKQTDWITALELTDELKKT